MKTVIPEEDMNLMYDSIPSPKAMARKLECEHGDMLYSADGYVTAWLLWQLQNDETAASAFTGDAPEILNNPLYRKQKIGLFLITECFQKAARNARAAFHNS